MLYILRSFMEHEPRAPSPHCNRNEKISKIKIGKNQMSSRHHMWRNLHRGNKKKLHNTKGRKREQVSQLRTSTSPFKTPNSRCIWDIVCTKKTTCRRNIMEGLLIACKKPNLNKQVHSFIAKPGAHFSKVRVT